MKKFTDYARKATMPALAAITVGCGDQITTLTPEQVQGLQNSVQNKDVCRSLSSKTPDKSAIAVACAEGMNVPLTGILYDIAIAGNDDRLPKNLRFYQQQGKLWQTADIKTEKLDELAKELLNQGIDPQFVQVEYGNDPNKRFTLLTTARGESRIILTTGYLQDESAQKIVETVKRVIERDFPILPRAQQGRMT